MERHVTRRPQHLRQHGYALRRLFHPAVGSVPERQPRGQHGAARQADRANHRAHEVRVMEAESAFGQPVEVRRLNLGVASRLDRVPPLIVGEDEENAGPIGRVVQLRAELRRLE